MNLSIHMKKQGGFALIEIILALVVLGYATIHVGEYYAAATKEPRQQATVTHMQRFVKALNNYAQNNNTALLATATAGSPATVTVPMLIATGDLPAGFSATNSYGATVQGQFLQPSSGILTGVAMAVGGDDPGELDAGVMAAKLGAKGGRVTSTGAAIGAYGGWNLTMTGYTAPGTNRLISYLDMDTGAGSATSSDALRRHGVAGHPEYNQMFTNLDMQSHDVKNAGVVELTTVVTAGTACPKNGAIATDSIGLTLSCQSGIWKKTTGSAAVVMFSEWPSTYGGHCANGMDFLTNSVATICYSGTTNMMTYSSYNSSYNLTCNWYGMCEHSGYNFWAWLTPAGVMISDGTRTVMVAWST